MHDLVQIKATIPRPLKRRAFAAFALQEERFNRWLRTQLEEWLRQVEEQERALDTTEQRYASVYRPQ